MQYIGITSIGVRERWYAHISCSRSLSSNNPMYKDMKEFGETSFEIYEIESGLSKEEADAREKELVKEYNTKWPNGYNLTDGGFKNDGVILSEDRSAKISDKLRGVPKSDEHKLHLLQFHTLHIFYKYQLLNQHGFQVLHELKLFQYHA